MKTYAFRLKPGQLLREEIDKFVKAQNIKAGIILACVGNVTTAVLRMSNAKQIKTLEGSFEIVSLVGTLESGNSHLHISVSDEEGRVYGGHLKQGTVVGVTAEIVLASLDGVSFVRSFDPQTGYEELVVEKES